jgi:phosphosulfolactate synthase
VNLGNIAPNEVVAMEALRCGMRGDTFFDFLPGEYQDKRL